MRGGGAPYMKMIYLPQNKIKCIQLFSVGVAVPWLSVYLAKVLLIVDS